jgi:hypothetical protein
MSVVFSFLGFCSVETDSDIWLDSLMMRCRIRRDIQDRVGVDVARGDRHRCQDMSHHSG